MTYALSRSKMQEFFVGHEVGNYINELGCLVTVPALYSVATMLCPRSHWLMLFLDLDYTPLC